MHSIETGIPSEQECVKLWDEYRTPANVRKHCELVRDIAMGLGDSLNSALVGGRPPSGSLLGRGEKSPLTPLCQGGQTIDLKLVKAGALLHDFMRFVGMADIKLSYFAEPPSYEDLDFWRELDTRSKGLNHAQAAGQELRKLGYPEKLALVVERHDLGKIVDPDDRPQTWEEKLVFYADKRALHQQIVSLEQRLGDGLERYPQYTSQPGEAIKQAAVYELERELFSLLDLKPDELKQLLKLHD